MVMHKDCLSGYLGMVVIVGVVCEAGPWNLLAASGHPQVEQGRVQLG